MRRHGLRAVITFGLLGTVLKLVLTGIAGSRGVYFLGLMVHGCFFSGALVGFNLYVDQRFPVADRPSLQALGTLFYQGIPTALAVWLLALSGTFGVCAPSFGSRE